MGDIERRGSDSQICHVMSQHIGVSGGYAFDGHDANYTYNGVPAEEIAILPSGASLSSNGGIIGGNRHDIQTNGVVIGLGLSWTIIHV